MSKRIIFKIDKEGNVSIDKVEGYGASCLDATREIERALGGVDESTRKLTDEYESSATATGEEHIRH